MAKKWIWRGGNSTHIVEYFEDGSERGVVAQVGTDGGTFMRAEVERNAMRMAAANELYDAVASVLIGLENGKGSVPFMITMLRAARRQADGDTALTTPPVPR